MKPEVFDLRATDDPRDVIHRVVECLAQGGVVALPTETVYGLAASAICPDAVERLVTGKGRSGNKPLALCIRGSDEARDWVPRMSALGRRLARRCWPGPVTLVFDEHEGVSDGLVRQLPAAVRRWVSPDGSLGLRVAAHDAVRDCQRLLPGPLVLTSANVSGGTPAVTGAEVAASLKEAVDLVLDDGRCRYGQASSVIKVSGKRWELIREGVVPAAAIERLARSMYLFVCTGNTCRSPMAEALFKRLLAERLGCAVDELPTRGYEVVSAGVSADHGSPASTDAVEAVRERGADLTGHMAHYLTAEAVRQADRIFAMTESHRQAIIAIAPEAADRVELLRRDGGNIRDPIGSGFAVYRDCAEEIEIHLREILSELEP